MEELEQLLQSNDVDGIKSYLNKIHDPDTLQECKDIALIKAVEMGKVSLSEALVNLGADLDAEDSKGQNLLYFALKSDNVDMVKLLIEKDFYVDSVIMRTLIEEGRLNMLEVVLKQSNEWPQHLDGEDPPPMMWATDLPKPKNVECVKCLVRNGFDVNSMNQDYMTALHVAAGQGDWKLVTVLLENGANVFSFMCNHYDLPFTIAVEAGYTDLAVKKLLPTDINASDFHPQLPEGFGVDFNGFTMLMYAAFAGHLASVRLLIEHGADPKKMSNHNGLLPIEAAMIEENSDVVEFLLPLSDLCECNTAMVHRWLQRQFTYPQPQYQFHNLAFPDGTPTNDYTPLMTACMHGYTVKVKCLLEHGADPDLVLEGKPCPLWCAAYGNNLQCVQTLLEYNPDMSLSKMRVRLPGHMLSDTTTLQQAMCNKNPELITLLVEAGCCLLNNSEYLDQVKPVLQAEVISFLQTYNTTPRPLTHIAKFAIRGLLGHRNLHQSIQMLPVPIHIKKYIGDTGL